MVECTTTGKGGKIMTEPYDNSNWREEYKAYTSSKYELDQHP